MATSPLVVYHGAPTRSARIIVALDELGKLDAAEVKIVEFLKGEHQTPEHTAVSKGWNTLPVLIIGEDTVLESGAALQLVLERFDKEGQLQVPVDAKERANYLYWLWFAEATLSQAIVSFLYHTALLPEDQRDPKSAERYKKAVFKCFDAIEAQLSDGRTWITGDKFTAADITLLHGLFLTIGFAKIADKESYPKTTAYFERIAARDTVKKAYSPLLG